MVEAVTGGRGIVARKARVEYWVDLLMGSAEVVGGRRSSNSSSRMGDEGSAAVTGVGRVRKGEVEAKRVERAVEGDMGDLFGTEVCIGEDVGTVGTYGQGVVDCVVFMRFRE